MSEINEISKKLAISFINRSADDVDRRTNVIKKQLENPNPDYEKAEKNVQKNHKRNAASFLAFKKLKNFKDVKVAAKEEVEMEEQEDIQEKDIGKKGKMFDKIADEAGKKYHSKEAGKKVAGAILAKLRAKHPTEYSAKVAREAVEELDEEDDLITEDAVTHKVEAIYSDKNGKKRGTFRVKAKSKSEAKNKVGVSLSQRNYDVHKLSHIGLGEELEVLEGKTYRNDGTFASKVRNRIKKKADMEMKQRADDKRKTDE